jgi:Cu/Ag efflux protein CusF
MRSALALATVAMLLFAAPGLNIANAGGSEESSAAATEVYTRAVVRSISKEDGERLYIRLKLIPRAKIPFSTLTYRVFDERLVQGLREGDSVAFKAERRDGENVVTAIHAAVPCERFKECK